jgi:hypothetical protein
MGGRSRARWGNSPSSRRSTAVLARVACRRGPAAVTSPRKTAGRHASPMHLQHKPVVERQGSLRALSDCDPRLWSVDAPSSRWPQGVGDLIPQTRLPPGKPGSRRTPCAAWTAGCRGSCSRTERSVRRRNAPQGVGVLSLVVAGGLPASGTPPYDVTRSPGDGGSRASEPDRPSMTADGVRIDGAHPHPGYRPDRRALLPAPAGI